MLQIEDLTFLRNDVMLFRNLSCSLGAGNVLQILGKNGSGKSTLLRILAGYMQTECGNISWHGKSIREHRDVYQQQLHYVGHQNGVKQNLTAAENLQLSAALRDTACTSGHVKNILEQVGLSHAANTEASRLSAGQGRRLALARLLLNPAPLWILDEPTTALDSAGQLLLQTLLKQHLATQGLVIVATHQTLALTTPVQTIQLGEPACLVLS
jgi:heme exporter protein A